MDKTTFLAKIKGQIMSCIIFCEKENHSAMQTLDDMICNDALNALPYLPICKTVAFQSVPTGSTVTVD